MNKEKETRRKDRAAAELQSARFAQSSRFAVSRRARGIPLEGGARRMGEGKRDRACSLSARPRRNSRRGRIVFRANSRRYRQVTALSGNTSDFDRVVSPRSHPVFGRRRPRPTLRKRKRCFPRKSVLSQLKSPLNPSNAWENSELRLEKLRDLT